jgi:hypothetical protein
MRPSRESDDEDYSPSNDKLDFDELVADAAQVSLEEDSNFDAGSTPDGVSQLLSDNSSTVSSAAASDVWYFMIPEASTLPKGHQATRLPGSYERPTGKVLECSLCR